MTRRYCLPLFIALALTASATGQQFVPAPKPRPLTELGNSSRARFGYVTVPEDRRNPFNMRQIRLAVIVVPARQQPARPDPVFYFIGGPGGAATLSSDGLPIFDRLNSDRDIVFADPRGAGYSQPLLFARFGAGTIRSFVASNFRALEARQIDPASYNTTEIAQDYNAVRAALGYPTINIFASSYGTFVAQEYLRHFSPVVRSLVMSGNFPATDSFLPTSLSILRGGLEALFRDVARDRSARRAYPNFRRRFYRLVQELERRPIRFQASQGNRQVRVDGSDLLNRTAILLQRTETIRLIPLLVTQLEERRTDGLVDRFLGPKRKELRSAFAMYLSVLATDFATPNYFDQTARAVAQDPRPALREVEGRLLAQLALIVEEWPVDYAPGTTRLLPTSSVPTLLLNGEMDAQTRASDGAVIARGLSRSTNYVYPRIGHAVGFDNGPALDAAIQFFNNPGSPPPFRTGTLLRRGFYVTRERARFGVSFDLFDQYPPIGLPPFDEALVMPPRRSTSLRE